MSKQILILDEESLPAENLRARLSAFGEAQVLSAPEAYQAVADAAWDLIVSSHQLGSLRGPALYEALKPDLRPVFLYSNDNTAVESDAWRQAGLRQAFGRLQRADLVLAAEQVLGAAPLSAGPAFLLVEDSPTVRQFVKTVLRQSFPGSEIVEADDGRSALAAMKSSRVSLIVTDLQMPGMDGLSFVQLLRNNAVLKKKPVLVLSGAVTDDVRDSLSSLEKVRILAKPAAPEALVGAVQELLSR